MLFGVALIIGGWEVVQWGRKSYLGPAEIPSFSSRDLSWCNEHDSFWLLISIGHFYVLFLRATVTLDFLPLEIYKHLVLSLSSITFTANRQTDNHFYKYVKLFQILYSKYEISFYIKIHVTYFIFKFDLNVKTPPFFFLIEAMAYRKKAL